MNLHQLTLINPFLKLTLWSRLQHQLYHHSRMLWKTITILTWLITMQEVDRSASHLISKEDLALQTASAFLGFPLAIITMWAIMNHLWTPVPSKRRKINSRASILTQIILEINSIERRPFQSQKKLCKTILLLLYSWKTRTLKIVD
jgi:hypothetical protein